MHPLLTETYAWVKDEKFYGKEKHETALVNIAGIRQVLLQLVASGEVDGRELRQFDTDKTRLVRLSEGRLFATRSKMIERDADNKRKGIKPSAKQGANKRDSNLEILARFQSQTR